MATNRKLKDDLLARLNVTERRLGQLATARKGELPMSFEQAVYTIAHENGVDVSKYLGPEEVAEIRGLVASLRSGARQPAPLPPQPGRRTPRSTKKTVSVKIAGVDVGKIPALKQSHADDAKRMAERVYPLLFIFENSVRDLIEAVLKDKHGKDWWTAAVPGTVQKTAVTHKEAEKRDPWHSPRGRREIDYVFLNDLWAIIKHRWADFKALFPDQAWVQTRITSDMNVSRRVLAHMNPLGADDIRNIEAAFSAWTKQLQAVQDKIP